MADPKHIKWLLEGVETWNKRRKNRPFTPDLSGEYIWSKFRDAGKLSQAGKIPLAGINLSRANLNGSDLRLADLAGANLDHADFREANLSNSSLNDSYMNFSKLNNADLSFARLDNAKLEHASISGANLCETSLIGANVHNVRLWEAVLYPKDKSPKQYPKKKPSVESIGDFLDIIRGIKNRYGKPNNPDEEVLIYFRGEPKCSWP